MRPSLKELSRESAVLLFLGCILGLGYNGATRKGIFGSIPAAVSPSVNSSESGPGFITYSEAVALFTAGKAVWVDARHEFDYTQGHIKGAVNIPLNEFAERLAVLSNIPKDTLLITYCDGAECNSSIELGTRLSAAGFTNVKIFFGGWKEWLSHHQPEVQ